MKISSLILIAILFCLHYQIWLPEDGLYHQYQAIHKKTQVLEQQNHQLRKDNAMLQAEVRDLQNGYEAVTELARHRLGYIHEGETFYLFKP